MVFTFLGRSKERVLEIKEFNVLLNLNEISDSREVKKHKKIDLKKKINQSSHGQEDTTNKKGKLSLTIHSQTCRV